ncbi:hypothetical protein THMIRHAS_04190 [Thiosulfatimonas sediminis]|uniref:Type II secretion system protein GspC N-terminal domain-containing protein n=1 Tax=Thiosulfatimonas sediminis TaxID=2675054 RepID=A0A6F8PSI3_9GAMM|nr:type II secretion system protein GspC [Thiosulfatimonas sediminis]BBP45046.1 hypothetical protein THMIRHAS_04190 [Thiosulfatimonas sediminis]
MTNKNYLSLFEQALAWLLLLAAFWVLGKVINQAFQPAVDILQPALQKSDNLTVAPLAPAKPSFLLGQVQVQPSLVEAEPNKPQVDDLENLQSTQLNIKLTGILYTPNDAVAVIEEGRNTLVLRAAEELRPQVQIEQIEPTFVVLNNRGKLEKLQLQESDIPQSPAGTANDVAPSMALDPEKLAKIRSDVKKTPLALNRYVRFRNLNRDGKMYALQVWPRQERELFEGLGFKSGDKILAVDGVSVGDMGQDPKQFQQLLQKSQFRLQIERSGQLQDLFVSL